MKYAAVIFDLDGTLLDNENQYCAAFEQVLKKHGVSYGKSCPHVRGIGLKENWEKLKVAYDITDASVSQLGHETQEAYHSRLREVKVRNGFFRLASALRQEGIRVALATSNDWWLVEDELEDLGLHKYFETVVTGEEVAYKKPAPDIYLETARKLGVEPSECVVIEDSVVGIEAAKEAGMVAVAMLDGRPEDFPRADLVVGGFEEITPKVLELL